MKRGSQHSETHTGSKPTALRRQGCAPWSTASRQGRGPQEPRICAETTFAARRKPQCTAKNILELTITGKIKKNPIIPDALIAASIAMGCVLFLHARLREIFGGSDRERMEHVGGDKTIIRDVDAQLNNLNKVFPVMAKAWEMKLPAINVYAIPVAPRGEDRTNEEANRLTWESFIVLQDNQTADEQQQRAFITNLLYSRDSAKKFIDIFDEDFGEEGEPAWWRISGGAQPAPEPKAMPSPAPKASSLVPNQARAPAETPLVVYRGGLHGCQHYGDFRKRGRRPMDHAGEA